MAWGRIAGALAVALLAACNRRPQPVYEYDETVTVTSTEKDRPAAASGPGAPAPADDAPGSVREAPSVRDAPVADGTRFESDGTEPAADVAAPVDETAPSAGERDEGEAPVAEDEWRTTVDTDAPPPREPRAPASASEPVPDDAPTSASDAPSAPRQWYKAKSW